MQELFGPLATLRTAFTLMPVDGDEDWATVAARMTRVPEAIAGYRASLAEGCRRGLFAAPRQVVRVTEQIDAWNRDAGGRGWFAAFAADASVSDAVRADLDRGAQEATTALGELRDWLATGTCPPRRDPGRRGPRPVPDREPVLERRRHRHHRGLRVGLVGVPPDPRGDGRRGRADRARRQRVRGDGAPGDRRGHDRGRRRWGGCPGAPAEDHGRDDRGARRRPLRPVRPAAGGRVPAGARGSATAPYYTPPALDFSRPGRTWLPENEDDRYPLWDLISTWYHEGVLGHHLQLASWAVRSRELSTFQTSLVGAVSADVESWALYAELLMDELGHHADPGSRLGYLNAQMLRAVRVVIDLGMHLSLPIPDDSRSGPACAGPRNWDRSSSAGTSAAGTRWPTRSCCATSAARPRRSATSSVSEPG